MKRISAERIFEHLAPSAQRSVSSSLNRARRGFDQDLVTPLCDKTDPEGSRQRRVSEIRGWLLPTGLEWLDEIEEERLSKIGSYSRMAPYADRKEQIYTYFNQRTPRVSKEELDYATNAVASLVKRQLVPAGVGTAARKLPRRTNQGYPLFTKGPKQEAASVTLAREVLISRKLGFIPPSMLYWRGQPRGPGLLPKQRTVFGYAHFIIVLEEMLQLAMLEVLRDVPEFAAWNHKARVDQLITEIFNTANQDILSVDFSGYDASVPKELIHAAFNVIRSWFSTSWWWLIDLLETVFVTSGLWTPEGILEDRSGGVPSGSGFTNLIDGIVQLLGFKIVEFRMRNPLLISTVQGDDGVHLFRNPWDLQDVAEIFDSLGMTLSSDKGGVSREMIFYLQNVHHTNYRFNGVSEGFRPCGRAWNGLLSIERFHKGWKPPDHSIRWRQQLQYTYRHPAFRKSVEFLWENDKLACLTLDELVKEAGGVEQVTSVLELRGFPYGKPNLQEVREGPVEAELHRFCSRAAA